MPIKLFTRDGGFVHEAVIPPFNEPPQVILWGSRVFTLNALSTEDAHVYEEAFAFALVS